MITQLIDKTNKLSEEKGKTQSAIKAALAYLENCKGYSAERAKEILNKLI